MNTHNFYERVRYKKRKQSNARKGHVNSLDSGYFVESCQAKNDLIKVIDTSIIYSIMTLHDEELGGYKWKK